jgi:hypothetical protein
MKRIIIAATAIAALLAPALMLAAPASAATKAVDNCSGSLPIVNVRGAFLEVTSANKVVATTNSADAQFWCQNTNSTGVTFEEHGGVECLQVTGGASVVGNCNNSVAGWLLTPSVYTTITHAYFHLENSQSSNCLYQEGIGNQLESMACQNVSGVTGDVWSYGDGATT